MIIGFSECALTGILRVLGLILFNTTQFTSQNWRRDYSFSLRILMEIYEDKQLQSLNHKIEVPSMYSKNISRRRPIIYVNCM